MNGTRYTGRFAPSPTGPLHFGSLVAAAGSYLHARRAGGEWRVRIEDVDTERNVPGAEAEILRALEAYGFEWDGPVLRQTDRLEAYAAALDALRQSGQSFACACSRSEVERASQALGLPRAVDGGVVYPGTCRSGLSPDRVPRAWRLRVPDPGHDEVSFVDERLGSVTQHLASEVGDFVLKRADGPFAYQLAVVVDDAYQGVTHVVRGSDLLDSTPRQIWLQRCLGVPTPHYLHLPLVLADDGQKLSKQTKATPLPLDRPEKTLQSAFSFLGLSALVELKGASCGDLWRLAFDAIGKSGVAEKKWGAPLPKRPQGL